MIPETEILNDFYEVNKFEYLPLKPTCFKDLFPSTIDIFLTNLNQSLMK